MFNPLHLLVSLVVLQSLHLRKISFVCILKKTIAQLFDFNEDGLFVVIAIVSGFVEGEEWWYSACKCHRSVVADSGVLRI